jgi:hypothetical protein
MFVQQRSPSEGHSNYCNQSNGSRQELENDEDGGQAAFLVDHHDDDDGDGGQVEVLQDIDNDCNILISTKAHFPKTRPLTFKNFMDIIAMTLLLLFGSNQNRIDYCTHALSLD